MPSEWWKEASIYQIYPASFKDTNDDGWGDLKGVLSKVDYLHRLGVDVVWISPVYKSPQADMGYDIADYMKIDPIYGCNEDIDALIHQLDKRGMRLMMDLVVNHTSNEHAWFQESASSKSSAKRDWYIWKDAIGMDQENQPLPPNNWSQILGDANSAWTWHPGSGQFYLSLFTPEQPDLNWETPAVRAAVHDVMRFWLDKGVVGFRMDVINLISKDQRFLDAEPTMNGSDPPMHYHAGSKWYVNGPRMHEFLQELKTEVLAPYNAITVGEMPGISDPNEILRTVNQEDGELNMIFIFDVVDIDNVPGTGGRLAHRSWEAADLARPIIKWQQIMTTRNGWNSVFIENHDNPRSVSRYCDDSDQLRASGAKLLALMQTTLSGTLFVYQGEELGMRNMPKSWPVEEFKDIESINFWKKSMTLHAGDELALQNDRSVLDIKARDHARTPMQWNDSEHAGFCGPKAKPWMRVCDDYKYCNAEVQENFEGPDSLSVWQFWQRGLACRKEHADAFVHGSYTSIDDATKGTVFAYLRSAGSSPGWLVVLNFGGQTVSWQIPEHLKVKNWVAGTYAKGKPDHSICAALELRPWEGILGQCQ